MLLIKYVINEKNIDFNIKDKDYSLMYHICKKCSHDVILCAFEKNVTYEFDDGGLALSLLFDNELLSNENKMLLIKNIIEKTKFDVNKKDNSKTSLLQYICIRCTYDVILCALEKNGNIYNLNEENDSVIHVLNENKESMENKMLLIEYLIDKKNMDLTYKNKEKISHNN